MFRYFASTWVAIWIVAFTHCAVNGYSPIYATVRKIGIGIGKVEQVQADNAKKVEHGWHYVVKEDNTKD